MTNQKVLLSVPMDTHLKIKALKLHFQGMGVKKEERDIYVHLIQLGLIHYKKDA